MISYVTRVQNLEGIKIENAMGRLIFKFYVKFIDLPFCKFYVKLIDLPFCVVPISPNKIQILNDTHMGICPPENVKFLGIFSFEKALFIYRLHCRYPK